MIPYKNIKIVVRKKENVEKLLKFGMKYVINQNDENFCEQLKELFLYFYLIFY